MNMDYSPILENMGLYFNGMITTLGLVGLALTLGLYIAIPLAFLRTSRIPFFWVPAWTFTYFFRGTPLLIQMYMIYYGIGQLEAVKESFLWIVFKEAYACALIAFSLNTAAYTTEILRGAITTMPFGEIEAARAFGMSKTLIYRRIILPSAFRRALPAYGNEVIFMLHGSAIASVITIIDITGAARIVNSRFYNPYEAFITAAALYMILTFLIENILKKVEKRWLAHIHR